MTHAGLILSLALASTLPAPLHLYSRDPLELRQLLRQRRLAGLDNAGIVSRLQALGDHSFDAFAAAGPGVERGFRLQAAARADWDRRRFDEAVDGYQAAARSFADSPAWPETGFSLYSAAAVRAEQERYRDSLDVVDRALAGIGRQPVPLLEGLLQESRGWALWHLDDLPEAVAAFEASLAAWRRVGYGTALIAGQNNIAVLWESLRVPERAAAAYASAGRRAAEPTLPEVRLRLLRNWSLFEARRGRQRRAVELLADAEDLRHFDPVGTSLWEAQIRTSLPLLRRIQPMTASQTVEWHQVAGRLALSSGQFQVARAEFETALETARAAGLGLLERQSAEELATVLESLGELPAAEKIYREAWLQAGVLRHEDATRPWIRLVSPLLSGWVRSLARQGRWREARARIHELVELRRRKALRLPPRRETGDRLSGSGRPRRYVVVELWPDSEQILVWIDGARGTRFLDLPWGEAERRTLSEVVSAFTAATDILPPPPSGRALRFLHQRLIEPLGPLEGSVLIVPHGILQALPFEVLLTPEGRWLGETVALSYLPSPQPPTTTAAPVSAPGLLIASSELEDRPAAIRERRSLLRLFPDAVRRADLPLRSPPFRWIHVSAHLSLSDTDWLQTTLAVDGGPIPLQRFVRILPTCDLLTLAACDTAPAAWRLTPWWMGLSEVLLARGVGSLLVTRWKLDEGSSRLFVDFYDRVRAGLPLDRALQEARRAFRRRGRSDPRRHPFYWAAVAYVGEPGRVLYPSAGAVGPAAVALAAALGVLFGTAPLRRR